MPCYVHYPLLKSVSFDEMSSAFDAYFDWSVLEEKIELRWEIFANYELGVRCSSCGYHVPVGHDGRCIACIRVAEFEGRSK